LSERLVKGWGELELGGARRGVANQYPLICTHMRVNAALTLQYQAPKMTTTSRLRHNDT
jgi:hypothetical protein